MNNNVRETFAESVIRIGLDDPRLVCIVSDISHFRLMPLYEMRPKQYLNLGVCENSIVNVAAGISSLGKIPVIHTFASFLVDRSFEQIKISFGYHKLPVNIVVIGSGIEYAFHGVTHHSYSDAAMIKTIEGSNVYNPGSTYEFDSLFESNYANGKINLFRATTIPHDFEDITEFEIKSGKSIKIRDGSGATIFCTGSNLKLAVEYSNANPEQDVEIIYFHTLKPLDVDAIINSVNKTKKFVTLDYQSSFGGLFQEVVSILAKNNINNFRGSEVSLGENFSRNYGTFLEQSQSNGFNLENLKSKLTPN